VGVVVILAIAAFALTRGQPAPRAGPGLPPGELQVKTIGRPPEPTAPPVAEPEPQGPVVTIDLPEDRAPVARERRKAPERGAPARPARPAPLPAREPARAEKATTTRLAAPAPVPPTSSPETRVEPDPTPPPPPPQPQPQEVTAPPPEPPTASSPLAVGPSVARDGQLRPRLKSPGCVAISLQTRRDVDAFAGESARVRFAVEETGKVSQFTYLSGPTDPRVANAIWSSIQRCDWAPGADAQGRPLTLWVTMPVSFPR
jgi:protein TonB